MKPKVLPVMIVSYSFLLKQEISIRKLNNLKIRVNDFIMSVEALMCLTTVKNALLVSVLSATYLNSAKKLDYMMPIMNFNHF